MPGSQPNAPAKVRLKVGKGGSILLPAAFRKALAVKAGDEVILEWSDGELCITTMKLRIERAQGNVRKYVKPGVSLADELIAERREEAKREIE